MYKTARGASGVEAKDQQQGINQGPNHKRIGKLG